MNVQLDGSRKNIAVFCASSNASPERYKVLAHEMGRGIAQAGFGLVYGGSFVGCMREVAEGARSAGGHVTGVIPEAFQDKGIADSEAELFVTRNLRDRKQKMEDLASGFVMLPAGIGTLEEFLEILTLRQIGFHTKPIVVVDPWNDYDSLWMLFDQMIENQFLSERVSAGYRVVKTVEEALIALREKQSALPDKWAGSESGSGIESKRESP